MDNLKTIELQNSQQSQPSYTAQNPEETAKAAKTDKPDKAARFKAFALPTVLYALFYTFCLYHNASGITFLVLGREILKLTSLSSIPSLYR